MSGKRSGCGLTDDVANTDAFTPFENRALLVFDD